MRQNLVGSYHTNSLPVRDKAEMLVKVTDGDGGAEPVISEYEKTVIKAISELNDDAPREMEALLEQAAVKEKELKEGIIKRKREKEQYQGREKGEQRLLPDETCVQKMLNNAPSLFSLS